MGKKNKADNDLYSSDFYADKRSSAIMAAAEAIYTRFTFYKEDAVPFTDLDLDTLDHYYIAGRNAVRAYHREAEKEVTT